MIAVAGGTLGFVLLSDGVGEGPAADAAGDAPIEIAQATPNPVVDTTGTFKHQKAKLKEDDFYIDKVGAPVYVLLPGSDEYIRLTPEIEQNIVDGKYRF